jgi:hypothetical protein
MFVVKGVPLALLKIFVVASILALLRLFSAMAFRLGSSMRLLVVFKAMQGSELEFNRK